METTANDGESVTTVMNTVTTAVQTDGFDSLQNVYGDEPTFDQVEETCEEETDFITIGGLLVSEDKEDDSDSSQSSNEEHPSRKEKYIDVSAAHQYILEYFRKEVFSTLTNSELEELIVQKLREVITERAVTGKLKRSAEFKWKDKAMGCEKLAKDLKCIFEKCLKDLAERCDQCPVPVRLMRSIGVQVARPMKKRSSCSMGKRALNRELSPSQLASFTQRPDCKIMPLNSAPTSTATGNSLNFSGISSVNATPQIIQLTADKLQNDAEVDGITCGEEVTIEPEFAKTKFRKLRTRKKRECQMCNNETPCGNPGQTAINNGKNKATKSAVMNHFILTERLVMKGPISDRDNQEIIVEPSAAAPVQSEGKPSAMPSLLFEAEAASPRVSFADDAEERSPTEGLKVNGVCNPKQKPPFAHKTKSDKRSFKCKKCGKDFRQKSLLLRHKRSRTWRSQPYAKVDGKSSDNEVTVECLETKFRELRIRSKPDSQKCENDWMGQNGDETPCGNGIEDPGQIAIDDVKNRAEKSAVMNPFVLTRQRLVMVTTATQTSEFQEENIVEPSATAPVQSEGKPSAAPSPLCGAEAASPRVSFADDNEERLPAEGLKVDEQPSLIINRDEVCSDSDYRCLVPGCESRDENAPGNLWVAFFKKSWLEADPRIPSVDFKGYFCENHLNLPTSDRGNQATQMTQFLEENIVEPSATAPVQSEGKPSATPSPLCGAEAASPRVSFADDAGERLPAEGLKVCNPKQKTPLAQKITSDKRSFKCVTSGKDFRKKSLLLRHERSRTSRSQPYAKSSGIEDPGQTAIDDVKNRVEKSAVMNPCVLIERLVMKGPILDRDNQEIIVKPLAAAPMQSEGKPSAMPSLLCGAEATSPRVSSADADERSPAEGLKVRNPKQKTPLAQKTTSDKRSFKCETCGKELKSKSTLLQHELIIHLGYRPYVCDDCGMDFGSKFNLERHQLRCWT